MATYLMEPDTQTIYTLQELRENFERYMQDQNADSNAVVDFDTWTAGLVEVVPNRVEEAGYDPKCGDWRKA